MEQYTDVVMDHFRNPRNVGEIENADGVGKVGNLRCGDIMYIYIKVAKRAKNDKQEAEEYIKDIKFKTLGCAAAIAASSISTELVKGKSLDEAAKLTRDDINESLGKLPTPKYHCSVLSADGIRSAIEDYKNKSKGKNQDSK